MQRRHKSARHVAAANARWRVEKAQAELLAACGGGDEFSPLDEPPPPTRPPLCQANPKACA